MSTTNGKVDVGVLGPQPDVPPHSPEGEEDPGEDVRVSRYQAVTKSHERRAHHPETCHRHWHGLLTLADRRKGKKQRPTDRTKESDGEDE